MGYEYDPVLDTAIWYIWKKKIRYWYYADTTKIAYKNIIVHTQGTCAICVCECMYMYYCTWAASSSKLRELVVKKL